MARKRNTLNLNKITKRNQRKKRKYLYASLKIIGITLGLFIVLYLGYFTAGLLFKNDSTINNVTPEENETVSPTNESEDADYMTVSLYIPAKKIISGEYKDIINQSKNNGYNNIILELKDSDGYIYYETSYEDAIKSNAVHKNAVNLTDIINLTKELDISLSVKLSAFKDNVYPSYNQKAAVCINDGMTWLDSQYKRWINSYSVDGTKYIEGICNELSSKYNISEILLSDISFVSNGKTHLISYEKSPQAISKDKTLIDFISLKKSHNAKIGIIEDSYYLYSDVTNEKNGLSRDVLLSGDFVCPIINPSLIKTPITLDGNTIENAGADLYKTTDLIYDVITKISDTKCYIKPVVWSNDVNKQISALKDNGQMYYIVYS